MKVPIYQFKWEYTISITTTTTPTTATASTVSAVAMAVMPKTPTFNELKILCPFWKCNDVFSYEYKWIIYNFITPMEAKRFAPFLGVVICASLRNLVIICFGWIEHAILSHSSFTSYARYKSVIWVVRKKSLQANTRRQHSSPTYAQHIDRARAKFVLVFAFSQYLQCIWDLLSFNYKCSITDCCHSCC